MAWTPLLLVLLSHCTGRARPRGPGSLSQPVLTQPPSLSASLGASARLTCTLSSGYSVASCTIYWYRQKPGSPPRYLLSYNSDSIKDQGSGVPSCFSGSKEASVNAGLLLNSGLQPEDEADYYCAIWYNSAPHSDTALASAVTCAVESRDSHAFILVHLYGVSENVSVPYWSPSANTMTLGPDANDPSQQCPHWRVTFLHLGPQGTRGLSALSNTLASYFLLLRHGVSAQTCRSDQPQWRSECDPWCLEKA
ncbi:uncharacterized protein LOC133075173 [Eubalaena glacialis]|uniref:uncharacterized protein LOC133075173 n=1 Tax=Eubalaena glacialis TaxID=27606 RepID=UPI002A5A8257|nr:uncharacterized protein LOC133075173 [Eubalaena glacialis]